MSSVQDHTDIEKLPLEIDGIPVRETIREIFRNPDNGTPDNISKAGCLALALVIVHKTLSLAVLFLIGLALRNLFKLK